VEPGASVESAAVPLVKGLTGGTGQIQLKTSQVGDVAPLNVNVGANGAIEADLGGAGLEV
jgi:hypothetical protein